MQKVYIANRAMKLQDGSVCKPGDVWIPPKGAGHVIIGLMLEQGHIKETVYIKEERDTVGDAVQESVDAKPVAKVGRPRKQPQQPSA
jgi:hypothetical protein